MVKFAGYAYRFISLTRQYDLKIVTDSSVPKGHCIMEAHPKDLPQVEKLIGGSTINDAFEKVAEVMTIQSAFSAVFQSIVLGGFALSRGPQAAYQEAAGRVYPEPAFQRSMAVSSVLQKCVLNLALLRSFNQGKAGPRSKDGGDDGGGPDGGDVADTSSMSDFVTPEPPSSFDLFMRGLTDADAVTRYALNFERVLRLQKYHKYCLLGFFGFAGVGGERNDLCREMIESGVIKLGDHQAYSKCALVYGLTNEPLGSHARVGLTGLTVAEHFRDVKGQVVLLFIGHFLGSTQVCVPAVDLTDPGLATTFSHLDATNVLPRQISELGIYTDVDHLGSTSRVISPRTLGEDHFNNTAHGVQNVLQKYKNRQGILAILGMGALNEEDNLIVAHAPKFQRFLTQPCHVVEVFTGALGKFLELNESVTSIQDDLPEQSFSIVGGIEEDCQESAPDTD